VNSGPAETTTVASGFSFPESPRWHDGSLWFCDMQEQRIHRLELDGTAEVLPFPATPGGLGWDADGRLLAVAMTERRLLVESAGRWDVRASVDSLTDGPLNDMVVDEHGNAYIGTLDALGPVPQASVIVLVRADGSTAVAADGLLRPNGCAFTADGRLVVGESGGGCLTAFEVAPDGRLRDRSIFARLPAGARPDGMCLDADGAAWVADLSANRLLRVLEGGEVTDSISTGDRHAVACVLGGTDGRTLFVCTAEHLSVFGGGRRGTGRIEQARVAVGAHR
jgi:sugar lactone lactonase YvrE